MRIEIGGTKLEATSVNTKLRTRSDFETRTGQPVEGEHK